MFNFTIIRDESFTAQAANLNLDLIEAVVQAAGEFWGRYIDAPAVNIDIELSLEDLAGDTAASAGPAFIDSGDGFFSVVDEQLATGVDTGDFGVLDFEAQIMIDLPLLLEDAFFLDTTYEPNPIELNSATNDLLTILLHEFAHILGFITAPFAVTHFEDNATLINGDYFFTGANAVAEFGGNVPLETLNFTDGSTVPDAHYTFDGALLSAFLTTGERIPVAPLEIAVLSDLGVNVVTESEGDDTLYGFEEYDDTVTGFGGSDVLFGVSGNDTLFGDNSISLSLDSVEGEVYRAFQAVFDRAPDLGGFNAFVTEVRAGRLTQETVIAEFVESAEFQQTFGTLDNQGFVEQLFRNVLDREGDAGGVTNFTNALNAETLTRAEVVLEFANSPEFVQLMTIPSASFATNVIIHPAEGQVFRIFQAVFDRAPDVSGFTNFVNSIQAGVLTAEQITAEFVASPEFQATFGDLDDTEFVELLFTNVLPGNMDQQGRADFIDALGNGTLTRAQMVAELADSQELRNSTADAADAFVATIFVDNGDTFNAGVGNDILFGGRGADTFQYNVERFGEDVIVDFTPGTDTLFLFGNVEVFNFEYIMSMGEQLGLDAIFDFGFGNVLTLENVMLTDLTAQDFGFSTFTTAGSSSPINTLQMTGEIFETTNGLNDFSGNEVLVDVIF